MKNRVSDAEFNKVLDIIESGEEPGNKISDSELDLYYLLQRKADHLAWSEKFNYGIATSRDHKQPVRYYYAAFEDAAKGASITATSIQDDNVDKYLFKLLVKENNSELIDLEILKANRKSRTYVRVLHIRREEASRLLKAISVVSSQHTTSMLRHHHSTIGPLASLLNSVDQNEVADILNADVLKHLQDKDLVKYISENRDRLTEKIEISKREQDLKELRDLVEASIDDGVKSPTEPDYQALFEKAPWLLGLSGQSKYFDGLDEDKLEQSITGYSISGLGRRPDAVMKYNSFMKSIAFIEIKRPDHNLLQKKEYRGGVFPPSDELTGAIAQAQMTANDAESACRKSVFSVEDHEGKRDEYLMVYPESVVVIGHSRNEFEGKDGEVPWNRLRSFEIYRKSLNRPRVVTYDEIIELAERTLQILTKDSEDSSG